MESATYSLNAIGLLMEGITLPNISPLIKYPKNSNYEILYPKLTEYLKNQLPNNADNIQVVNTIHDLTDAPIETIQEALSWGKGPEIRIEQLGGIGDNEKYGSYRGHVNSNLVNVLFLVIDLVEHLENSLESEFSDAMEFLIAATLLHEYTHLGDNIFGDNFWGNEWIESGFNLETEAGVLFEEMVFGDRVGISNAGVILKRSGGL